VNKEQPILQNKYSCQTYTEDCKHLPLKSTLLDDTQSIKILMIGDVIGRSGRRILKKCLNSLRQSMSFDFVTINGENLAGGFGITEKIYGEIMEMGVDAITMGNHWKDKTDIHNLRSKYKNIILPHNLIGVSGVGKAPLFFLPKRNKNVSVINLMGTFAMKEEYESPFVFLVREKENFIDKVQSENHIIIADIHAEASSEKQAIAYFYDGILAALIGTHTHTPTSDERMTAKGTAFLTDVGMTGAYDSIIGMNKERIIKKLISPQEKVAHEVAENHPWFCGFLVEVSVKNGLALSGTRIQCREVENDHFIWMFSRVSSL
jgi:metallophosphoesterase (TIGR00282 family)